MKTETGETGGGNVRRIDTNMYGDVAFAIMDYLCSCSVIGYKYSNFMSAKRDEDGMSYVVVDGSLADDEDVQKRYRPSEKFLGKSDEQILSWLADRLKRKTAEEARWCSWRKDWKGEDWWCPENEGVLEHTSLNWYRKGDDRVKISDIYAVHSVLKGKRDMVADGTDERIVGRARTKSEIGKMRLDLKMKEKLADEYAEEIKRLHEEMLAEMSGKADSVRKRFDAKARDIDGKSGIDDVCKETGRFSRFLGLHTIFV
jgi:hypothetical protein